MRSAVHRFDPQRHRSAVSRNCILQPETAHPLFLAAPFRLSALVPFCPIQYALTWDLPPSPNLASPRLCLASRHAVCLCLFPPPPHFLACLLLLSLSDLSRLLFYQTASFSIPSSSSDLISSASLPSSPYLLSLSLTTNNASLHLHTELLRYSITFSAALPPETHPSLESIFHSASSTPFIHTNPLARPALSLATFAQR